jgi:hypothetical protein
LLHFHEKIPDVKLNIRNRERQLFKPLIRLFEAQSSSPQSREEILKVVSKYVSQRRESKANTLHAWLYELVRDLIKAQNTYELPSNLIWNTVRETLQGKDILYKPQSYDTVEFGVISQKGIIETLIDVFGAKQVKRHSGRSLILDDSKLQRLANIYELSIDVKVDVADVAHVGLDKHLQEQYEDKEISISERENENISNVKLENNEKITLQEEVKGSQAYPDVPQAPHVPPKQEQEEHILLNQGAYWSGSKWYCKSCKYSYDGPGMIQHLRLDHNQQSGENR